MQIDKCIVYLATQNPMTRVNYSEGDVAVRRIPISLPRVSCLDDPLPNEPQKYFPYNDDDPEQMGSTLTLREKRALRLFKEGSSILEIARVFKCSQESVRWHLSRARAKLRVLRAGERAENEN